MYAGWLSGSEKTRELLLSEPELFLRAQGEARRAEQVDRSPAEHLLQNLGALAGIARRARRRLEQGLAGKLLTSQRRQLQRGLLQAKYDTQMFFDHCEKELCDARPEHENNDSQAA